ncbi:MAG: hypothetical protein K2N87_09635 [Eubacterium sp.]|nr:hypothetical protein [Eubacterium sp.]
MTDTNKLDLIINQLGIMKSDISDIKSDVGTLKSDVTSLKSDVTTLKSDVTALKSDVATLKSDVTALKSDVAAQKADIESLKADMATQKADISSLKSDVADLKIQLSQTQLHLENKTDRNIVLLAENHSMLIDKLNQAIPLANKNLTYEVKVEYALDKISELEKDVADLKTKTA